MVNETDYISNGLPNIELVYYEDYEYYIDTVGQEQKRDLLDPFTNTITEFSSHNLQQDTDTDTYIITSSPEFDPHFYISKEEDGQTLYLKTDNLNPWGDSTTAETDLAKFQTKTLPIEYNVNYTGTDQDQLVVRYIIYYTLTLVDNDSILKVYYDMVGDGIIYITDTTAQEEYEQGTWGTLDPFNSDFHPTLVGTYTKVQNYVSTGGGGDAGGETFDSVLALFNHNYQNGNSNSVYRMTLGQAANKIKVFDTFGDGINGLGFKITSLDDNTTYCTVSNTSESAYAIQIQIGTQPQFDLSANNLSDGSIDYGPADVTIPAGECKIVFTTKNPWDEHYFELYYNDSEVIPTSLKYLTGDNSQGLQVSNNQPNPEKPKVKKDKSKK